MSRRGRYVFAFRAEEAVQRNKDLKARISALESLLADGLQRKAGIDFGDLRERETYPHPKPPVARAPVPPDKATYAVAPLAGLSRFLPGAKAEHERAVAAADLRYAQEFAAYTKRLRILEVVNERALAEYGAEKAKHIEVVKKKNAEVRRFEENYKAGDPGAIVAYNELLLETSPYPEGFPKKFRIAFVPESKELACEYELPPIAVVPSVGEYRHIKSRDEIEEKPRKPAATKDLYQDIIASLSLRTLHELFFANAASCLQVVAFNGFVQTVDPATGRDIRPCLISLRVTRDQFEQLDLARVSKAVCLRNLGAQVSPRPNEAQAVRPIVEFDMVDKRFVKESDVLSALESRPNLMDLNPFEFEHLVANLFGKMGLDTKLTRSSRDGGVDAVAFDPRPILGGKVVIQAKRYKNTVGVSAVRDLYGTMLNEGASKGILVTTSGYGPDAFEFAKDKPIELIDGGGLLYLLKQVGTDARIVFPDDAGSGLDVSLQA